MKIDKIPPIKRNRVAAWMKNKEQNKHDPHICCLQETHFRLRTHTWTEIERIKKIFHANINQKKSRLVLLISNRIDFETKTLIMRQRRALHNDEVSRSNKKI